MQRVIGPSKCGDRAGWRDCLIRYSDYCHTTERGIDKNIQIEGPSDCLQSFRGAARQYSHATEPFANREPLLQNLKKPSIRTTFGPINTNYLILCNANHTTKTCLKTAVIVAQLAERLPQTPEVHHSNTVIGQMLNRACVYCLQLKRHK